MMSTNSPTNAAAASTEESGRAEVNLLEWLEGFAEKLKARTNAVADKVQQVVEEMEDVELNLQNTFNSFRSLSSSQFVENHVYEEDETDLVTTGMSKKDANQPSMPTESYEDEILPRYKDAVAFAWSALQRGGRHDDQRSVQLGPRSQLRDSHQDERIQILPRIIGSEEFARDAQCGLADLRHQHLDPESDNDVERAAASLVAESTGTRILSDGEISGTDSDAFDYQEKGLEPAVSAALDFKAMLEAALRNPSLPYDGGTSNDSSFGEFADNKFSLPNMTDDYLNDTPRNISTMVDIIGRTMCTMDESKDELRDSASQQSNANVGCTKPPLATLPPDVLDDPAPSSTIEELLKYSITQSMLNQEFKQDINSNNGSNQIGSSDLGDIGMIPGGLFSDETRDTAFLTEKNAIVPNSSTGPTIPEGLFQEKLPPEPTQHKRIKSQSSNSLDSSEIPPLPLASFVDIVPMSSKQDSDSVLTKSENNGSEVAPSLIPKHANLQSVSPSISSGSMVVFGSRQASLAPLRGGLFDDDEDEEDEDEGGLLGAPEPRANKQPVLKPWASQSNKGLFDDIAAERDGTTSISDEAGSSKEAPHKAAFLSLITSEYRSQAGEGASDLSKQPTGSASSVQTYSESIHVEIVNSSGLNETVSNNASDVKEDLQPSIQSTVAAALKSSVPSIAESDDDSWSGSESEVEDSLQGRNVREQRIHQDASIIIPQNGSGENPSESSTAGVGLNLGPEVPVESEHVSESLSDAEEILTDVDNGEGENAIVSPQTPPEELPARFPLAASRSSSSTEALLKVPVNLPDNPLLQSKALEFSDAEASDSSDSAGTSGELQSIGQRQIVQNVLPASSTTENLGPLISQPTIVMNETRDLSSQNSGKSRISEDWSKAAIPSLPVPVKELGRSTRTFTPLFEDDDAEEDLFDRGSPQCKGALFPRSGQVGTLLSSDATVRTSAGQGRVVETESPLTTPDTHPQLPRVLNPSSKISVLSHPIIAENKGVDLSSTTSGSKLSSLLFGDDDDEDDEDTLFGPLGGRRNSRELKSGTARSIFGDASLLSTSSPYPPKKGNGLLEDGVTKF